MLQSRRSSMLRGEHPQQPSCKRCGSNTDRFPGAMMKALHSQRKTIILCCETKPTKNQSHNNNKDTGSAHQALAPQVNETLSGSHKLLIPEEKPSYPWLFHCWCLTMCHRLCGYANHVRKWMFFFFLYEQTKCKLVKCVCFKYLCYFKFSFLPCIPTQVNCFLFLSAFDSELFSFFGVKKGTF